MHRPLRLRLSFALPFALTLVALLLAGQFVAGGSGAVGPALPGAGSISPDILSQKPLSTPTLELGGGLGNLTPEFWAANYNFQSGGFNNHTVAALLNQTPITWLRFPLIDTSYASASSWKDVLAFCQWIHCHSIATVGGPNTTAQQGANEVFRAESLGLHPDYWVFGNEPNIWPGETATGYANLVLNWTRIVRQSDPTARFIGVEINGNPRVGSGYIYNVTKIDGPFIQGLAIQDYPQNGGTTLTAFLGSLTVQSSVQNAMKNARALMTKACPTCSIPLLVNEVNGGSGYNTNYIPFREGFADATFLVASMVQGLRLGLQQFAPWTLTAASNSPASGANSCDFGMIQLLPGCDGTYLQPTYRVFQNLLSLLPYGSLTNVTLPGVSDFYGVQVINGTHRALLLVNANASVTENFTLGNGFPSQGSLRTSLMDLSHPSFPLVNSSALPGVAGPVFTLPPAGVMVIQFSPPPKLTLTAIPSSVSLGGTTTLQAQIDGSPAGLSYSFPKLPPGCSTVNASQLNCTPTEVGTFPARVTADQGGAAIATAETNVTIVGLPSPPPPSLYAVTFVASGLPAGTVWAVDFNGSPVRSSEPTISIAAANGTFVYSLAFVPGYVPAPAEGFVAVKGAPITLSIQWRPFTMPISFVEAGLPAGTPWSLRVDGTNLTTTNMSQELTLVNGSYSFTVAPVSPFVPVPSSGVLNVTGVPQLVALEFSSETVGSTSGLGNSSRGSFAMTFQAVGLPPTSSWTLTLDGVGYPLDAAEVTTDLSLGTHTFRVEANGYTASPASGIVGPQEPSSLQVITFSAVSPSAPLASPGPSADVTILLASPLVWGTLFVVGASVWWLRAARRRSRRRR